MRPKKPTEKCRDELPSAKSLINPKHSTLQCAQCGLRPHEIPEIEDAAFDERSGSPSDFVKQFDGTYNERTNTFWCTACYVQLGCPPGKACYGKIKLKKRAQIKKL